jgi:hypothetical protein
MIVVPRLRVLLFFLLTVFGFGLSGNSVRQISLRVAAPLFGVVTVMLL